MTDRRTVILRKLNPDNQSKLNPVILRKLNPDNQSKLNPVILSEHSESKDLLLGLYRN